MAQAGLGILNVTVAQGGIDDERLDVATQELIQVLRQEARVDAQQASLTDNLPKDARFAEAVTLGAIVLALIPSAIPAVVDAFKLWLESAKNRRIIVRVGDKSIEFDPKTTPPDMLDVIRKCLEGASKI